MSDDAPLGTYVPPRLIPRNAVIPDEDRDFWWEADALIRHTLRRDHDTEVKTKTGRWLAAGIVGVLRRHREPAPRFFTEPLGLADGASFRAVATRCAAILSSVNSDHREFIKIYMEREQQESAA